MKHTTVKIPKEVANALAKKAAGLVDIETIIRKVLEKIPKPQDGKNLVMTEAIRTDVIESVTTLVPQGKPGKDGQDGKDGLQGQNFTGLTDQQISEIVQIASKQAQDLIVDRITEEALFVSREQLSRQLRAFRSLLNKEFKPATAGISGQDMVAELDKVLGSSWRSGNAIIDAMITFDGTGVVSIYASTNISLLTDNAIGQYTITFIKPMPNPFYAIGGSAGRNNNSFAARTLSSTEVNANFLSFATYLGTGFNDINYVSVIIVR